MERFIEKEGKRLRYGYTTGSCATAATKGAAMMLVSSQPVNRVRIDTPKGWELFIDVYPVEIKEDEVTCYVVKDGGDDPDVTHGMRIYSTVKRVESSGIHIRGGVGIGTVTKPGLRIPVGESAINPTPLRTIEEAVRQVLPSITCSTSSPSSTSQTSSNPRAHGIDVTIYAPEGETIARKTFNANLGIHGGISIIGTSGIVEPMSEDALKDTLKVELGIKKANNGDALVYVFGNFGRDYALELGIEDHLIQKISNYVAYMIEEASSQQFQKILFIGHVGKMVKVAAGRENTHSKYGDGRMASIAECARACHVDEKIIDKILVCNTTDEAVGILTACHHADRVFTYMANKCQEVCEAMSGKQVQVESIIFSTIYGRLGSSSGIEELLDNFTNKVNLL